MEPGGKEAARHHNNPLLYPFELSFGTHWALPIFLNAGAVAYFFLVNSVLFPIITAIDREDVTFSKLT